MSDPTRDQVVAALRAAADLLASDPEIPVPTYVDLNVHLALADPSEQECWDSVRLVSRLAERFGRPEIHTQGNHVWTTVSPLGGGPVRMDVHGRMPVQHAGVEGIPGLCSCGGFNCPKLARPAEPDPCAAGCSDPVAHAEGGHDV